MDEIDREAARRNAALSSWLLTAATLFAALAGAIILAASLGGCAALGDPEVYTFAADVSTLLDGLAPIDTLTAATQERVRRLQGRVHGNAETIAAATTSTKAK